MIRESLHKLILIVCFLSCGYACTAQQPSSSETDTTIYSVVDKPAEFAGGETGLLKYVRNNMNYNDIPGFATFKGRLRINFVVEVNGCTTNITTFPSGYESEFKRLFDLSPVWIPASIAGKNVRSRGVFSLYFNLH